MNRGLIAALLVITGIGALLRSIPVFANGFPLNDGGLFLAMAEEIRHGWPGLPETVIYNREALPLAYPPLGLYLTAGVITLGMDGTLALQVIPVVVSIATIPAAYLLFRRLLDTELLILVATAAFAVIPRAYEVTVAGGGVTRGPGLLLALLALVKALDWMRSERPSDAIFTGVLLGASGLSHPQAGVFAASSLLILAAFRAPRARSTAVQLVGVLLIAALLAAPWLLVVVQRHGLETLIGAFGTGGSTFEGLLLLAGLRFSDGLFEIAGVIGIVGLVLTGMKREWLYPTWFVVTVLVSSRAGLNYGAAVLGIGVAVAVGELLRVFAGPGLRDLPDMRRSRLATGVLAGLALLAVADSAASRLNPTSPLHGLSPQSRDAIAWIADNTPEGSTVLVLSGTGWFIDAPSEWMPLLSGRRSSATVQGSEWLGRGVFRERESQYVWLQSCAADTRDNCVAEWERVVEPVDYVLALDSRVADGLGQPCCLEVVAALADAGADVVYENREAIVLDLPDEPLSALSGS